MAFSWKKAIKRSLLEHKIRYRLYLKSGSANTLIGQQLKKRIERIEKELHG